MLTFAHQAELPVRHFSVFPAEAFRVAHGVNEGDALSDAAELVLEDSYALAQTARTQRLALACGEDGRSFLVAPGSPAGAAGAPVYLDSLLTFMDASGATSEVLVFVEVDGDEGMIAQVYLHPLAPLTPKTGYSLVTIERESAGAKLAATAAVAFTRGTRITLAGGRQVAIEALAPGDKVLTRDSGPQVVRWIGMQTLRATGDFAPITIAPGTLNNTGELVVSPNHRLFIYQRIDAMGAGRKELLVRAGLLVNGTTVVQEPGGFVDYFQVLFDKHEILYAEGIAAESLFVDRTTRPALPEAVTSRLSQRRTPAGIAARELQEADLAARHNTAALLKRISAF